MNATRIAGSLAWILAAAALAGYPIVLGPFGVVLTFSWGLLLIAARWLVSWGSDARARLLLDVAFGVVCLLGAFEGGWYLLPAAIAFGLGDAGARHGPHRPPVRRWSLELVAGLAALLAGAVALAWLTVGPAYGFATSSSDGGESVGTTTFVAVNGGHGVAVLLIVGLALCVLAIAAVVHTRTGSAQARYAVGVSTVAILAVAVLGAASIGMLLLPAAVLSAVTFALAAPAHQP